MDGDGNVGGIKLGSSVSSQEDVPLHTQGREMWSKTERAKEVLDH